MLQRLLLSCLVCYLLWCSGSGSEVVALAPVWSNPYVDAQTLTIGIDVTSDIPYSGGSYEFLMVGTLTDLPYRSACPARAVTTAQRTYSCASLSYDELIPYGCTYSRHTGRLAAFTISNLAAAVYEVVPSSLFIEADSPSVNRGLATETTTTTTTTSTPSASAVEMLLGTGTGTRINNRTHFHYDLHDTVSGVALYNGECLLGNPASVTATSSACATPSYGIAALPTSSDTLRRQPDTFRLHAAKVVPFLTFPSTTRMTRHFQYRVTQLQTDCASRMSVRTIYSPAGYVLGFAYGFTLTLGSVQRNRLRATDSRAYDLRLLTNSLSGSFASYSIVVVSTAAASHAIDVSPSDNPLVLYSADGTRAQLRLAVTLTVTTTSGLVPPTLYALPTNTSGGYVVGASAINVTSAAGCIGLTLQSITPANSRLAASPIGYCPSATTCSYVLDFLTPMTLLKTDGTAFMTTPQSSPNAACVSGQYPFRFTLAKCRRVAATGALLSTPTQPCRVTDTTLVDEVRLQPVKYVFPRTTRMLTQLAHTTILPTSAPTYAMLLGEMCANHTTAAWSASLAAFCGATPEAREPNSSTSSPPLSASSALSILFAWDAVDQWRGATTLPTLMVDTYSLQFQVSGYAFSQQQTTSASSGWSPSVASSFVRTLSYASNSSQWQRFEATWLSLPRNGSTGSVQQTTQKQRTALPLVHDTSGTDGFSLPFQSLRTFVAADIAEPFVLQSLIVSGLIVPYRASPSSTTGNSKSSKSSRRLRKRQKTPQHQQSGGVSTGVIPLLDSPMYVQASHIFPASFVADQFANHLPIATDDTSSPCHRGIYYIILPAASTLGLFCLLAVACSMCVFRSMSTNRYQTKQRTR